MAAIKKVTKHGNVRWRVSHYTATGRREQRFFATRQAAADYAATAHQAAQQKRIATLDPRTPLADFATTWLRTHALERSLKPATVDSYQEQLRHHVLPWFEGRRCRDLTTPAIRALLAHLRERGYARDSLRLVLATCSVLGTALVDAGVLAVNPAQGLRKTLRLAISKAAREDEVHGKAMTQEQLDAFLATAQEHSALFPLFLTMARTGLRPGEALALGHADLDLDTRTARIRYRLDRRGRLDTVKTDHGRRSVDLSQQVVAVLRDCAIQQKADKLRRSWPELPPWCFTTRTGTPFTMRNLHRAFVRVVARAGLPDQFSPHCLRHTFATLALLAGKSIVYVQQQLGHSSIQLTVDTYGSWLKIRDTAAADEQDARSRLVVKKA